MSRLVLDSGGVTHLSRPSREAAASMAVWKRLDIWLPQDLPDRRGGPEAALADRADDVAVLRV
jgi:hypothetical protein